MSDDDERPPDPRLKILRWIGMAMAAPIVVVFVLIMYFVARTELAHDDADCPFSRVETRELADGVVVHDERRRCQQDVEEHRWLLERDGEEVELGRRRLEFRRYAEGQWRWLADQGDRGAHVHVENAGIEDADFHEDPPSR